MTEEKSTQLIEVLRQIAKSLESIDYSLDKVQQSQQIIAYYGKKRQS